MRFLAPAALWFAAAIPVVIALYLLKRKRVSHLVPSTLLWEKYLAETQANTPFQKLRYNWLLLLQILLLIVVVIALARPYLATLGKSASLRIAILDASASMQSTDESPSRFEKARSEAIRWVDSLRDGEQMVILQAAAATEVKQSPTSEKAALRRALRACAVTDGPTRLTETFKLAESLVRSHPGSEIHLFSDGAAPGLADLGRKNLPLVYHRMGQRGNNVGIVSLDIRANPEDPAQRALFASIANPTVDTVNAEVEFRFDGQWLETRDLTFAPTNTTSVVYSIPSQEQSGVFTIHLAVSDDLAADNQASIVSLLPRPLTVLLVTRGNRFLEKALRGVKNVELSKADDLVEASPSYDIVVLDDVTPTVWPQINTLAIHLAPTNWFGPASKVESPTIVAWKNAHPSLRFVTFDNIQIADSLSVEPPDWTTSLVEAAQTPLILAGEQGSHRMLWIGFDLLQSTWPLRVSFPIFMANAMDWLDPRLENVSRLTIKAGEPFRMPLSQPANAARVTLPTGTTQSLALDTNSVEVVFGETHNRGVYHLAVGTNETVFCVNAMDAAESDTAPRSELRIGQYGKAEVTSLQRASTELWRPIAAIALLVLMFEWWYYHRRTA